MGCAKMLQSIDYLLYDVCYFLSLKAFVVPKSKNFRSKKHPSTMFWVMTLDHLSTRGHSATSLLATHV